MSLPTDKDLNRVLKAFEMLRLMDREIPGQLVSTLLYVASHNPCLKKNLEKDLQLTSSSASRLTDWLSDYHRLGKPGLGLVKKYKDQMDLRVIKVALTPKGEHFIHQFRGLIFENENMG